MTQTGTVPSSEPDWISSTVKLLLFVIPSTVVTRFFPHGHEILFGASFIAGAFLQALVPPRMYKVKYIFGIAIAAAIVIPVLSRLAGWN